MFTRLGWAERRRALRDARVVDAALPARLIAEGIQSHIPRRYSRLNPWQVKGPILVQPKPTSINLARLRDAGLSEPEVEDVMLVGRTLDELNVLYLRGIDAHDKATHHRPPHGQYTIPSDRTIPRGSASDLRMSLVGKLFGTWPEFNAR